MKRINNKGFMLAEIIIVSAILATALVGLFATFSKMFIEYEKRSVYESIDAIYFGRGIARSDNNLLTFFEEKNTNVYKEINSTSNEYTKKYKVVHSYVLKYNQEAIESLITNVTTLSEKYKEYLKYLKNNLDFNDGSCNYIIVTELSDNCDGDGCYEDNGNINLGYYKIN